MIIAPRWKKMIRDFTGNRGRSFLLLISVSVGLFGVTAILGAYSILSRELTANYMNTNPASATVYVGEVTDAALESATNFPGVAEVEARTVMQARVQVGGDWMPMLLFVINDFEDLRLNTFSRVSGAWPPPTGTMLVERDVPSVLKQNEGGSVLVRMPHGYEEQVQISGIVHDATLAPARQEQSGYGYITLETLIALGEAPVLEELRILFDGNPDAATAEAKALELAKFLKAEGHEVHQLRVPPPHKHPHQSQVTGILFMLLSFAVMAFVLSTILVAAIIAAVLAKQVREIGMMKAVGALSGQISRMYLSILLLLGAISVVIGIPLGIGAAWMFADMVADLLNLEIYSYTIPTWVIGVLTLSGLILPALVALPIVYRGCRLPVHEALGDFGVKATSFGEGRLDIALGKIRGIGLAYRMAIRNMFRRRGRLILALTLLTTGGGMFMTALNVSDGWRAMVGRIDTERFYDVEFLLHEAIANDRIEATLNAISDIKNFELWGARAITIAREGNIEVTHTYPDGGHGSFSLIGLPSDTKMIRFPLIEGRWLQTGDLNTIVINQGAKSMMPNIQVGEMVTLSSEGNAKSWRLVGMVEEVGSPAAAYVTSQAYNIAMGTEGTAQLIRLSTVSSDSAARQTLIRNIDSALVDAGISIKKAVPLKLLRTAMGEHVTMLISTLMGAAVLLAAIGTLGLSSTMAMNVIERTRELGIMRATGATPKLVLKTIISESVSIGLMGWILAIPLSLPLSYLVGSIVGNMSFKIPLPLTVSPFAMIFWLILITIIAAIAAAIPARQASKLVIREALSYE